LAAGGRVELADSVSVLGNLRLISANSLIDIKEYNLYVGENSGIYSTAATTDTVFNAGKCIFMSAGANSGSLIRGYAAGLTLPNTTYFPIGTPGQPQPVFTPNKIVLNNVVVESNASIASRAVAAEHPAVEAPGRSLVKYWTLRSKNITFNDNGADVYFYYNSTGARGTEGSYEGD
jgi:hypothetical protein